jgi:hypothetical protein
MKYNGVPIINLPECEVMSVKLKFDPNLRKQYDLVHSLCKRRIECYLKGASLLNIDDTIGSNWGYVLVMLTRLRQFSDHPELIPPEFISKMSLDSDIFENESSQPSSIFLLEILKAVVDSGEGYNIRLNYRVQHMFRSVSLSSYHSLSPLLLQGMYYANIEFNIKVPDVP